MTLTDAARKVVTGPLGFLKLLRQPDYFGLLVYLPPDEEAFARVLRALHLHLPRRDPDTLRRVGERLIRAD